MRPPTGDADGVEGRAEGGDSVTELGVRDASLAVHDCLRGPEQAGGTPQWPAQVCGPMPRDRARLDTHGRMVTSGFLIFNRRGT
jgi:hypothetical protein